MRIFSIATAVVLTLNSCAEKETKISFRGEILPILNSYCVVCHFSGAEQGGLVLSPDALGNLVNMASTQSPLMRIKPGSAEKSYLFHKLIGTHSTIGGSGEQMPSGQTPLEAVHIEKIHLWIEQGATAD